MKTKKKAGSSDQDRGELFLKTLKLWRILHDDRGRTAFNKSGLAKVYFGIKKVGEKHKRYVQRLMVPLVKAGIVRVTDRNGAKPEDNPTEIWWTYNNLPIEGLKRL